jgi:hypothetical protein
MSKPAVILLIVTFELGILFAGQGQTQTFVRESLASVNMLAPLSVSGSLHSGTPEENRLPMVWDIAIDYLGGFTTPAYLTRSTRYQKQNPDISRAGSGVKIDTSGGGEIARQGGGPKMAACESPSVSFSALSLPGLILRL